MHVHIFAFPFGVGVSFDSKDPTFPPPSSLFPHPPGGSALTSFSFLRGKPFLKLFFFSLKKVVHFFPALYEWGQIHSVESLKIINSPPPRVFSQIKVFWADVNLQRRYGIPQSLGNKFFLPFHGLLSPCCFKCRNFGIFFSQEYRIPLSSVLSPITF